MVAGFRRSVFLSGPNPNCPGRLKGRDPEKPSHVRSTSLPCPSHPLISQIEGEIRALRLWQSGTQPEPGPGSPAWLGAGLDGLELLHAALDDLLHLPRAQDSLRRSAARTEWLLDDFLRLADAHGSLRAAVVALKQHQSAAQVAIRRGDEARLASCVRSQRRVEKELARLASVLRDESRSSPPALLFESDASQAELAGILTEAAAATASASAAVLLGIAAASSAATGVAASSSSCSPPSRASWMASQLRRLSSSSKKRVSRSDEEAWRMKRRRSTALESLEGMEGWVPALESSCERVFRGVVNTRVSLLNILTPST